MGHWPITRAYVSKCGGHPKECNGGYYNSKNIFEIVKLKKDPLKFQQQKKKKTDMKSKTNKNI